MAPLAPPWIRYCKSGLSGPFFSPKAHSNFLWDLSVARCLKNSYSKFNMLNFIYRTIKLAVMQIVIFIIRLLQYLIRSEAIKGLKSYI